MAFSSFRYYLNKAVEAAVSIAPDRVTNAVVGAFNLVRGYVNPQPAGNVWYPPRPDPVPSSDPPPRPPRPRPKPLPRPPRRPTRPRQLGSPDISQPPRRRAPPRPTQRLPSKPARPYRPHPTRTTRATLPDPRISSRPDSAFIVHPPPLVGPHSDDEDVALIGEDESLGREEYVDYSRMGSMVRERSDEALGYGSEEYVLTLDPSLIQNPEEFIRINYPGLHRYSQGDSHGFLYWFVRQGIIDAVKTTIREHGLTDRDYIMVNIKEFSGMSFAKMRVEKFTVDDYLDLVAQTLQSWQTNGWSHTLSITVGVFKVMEGHGWLKDLSDESVYSCDSVYQVKEPSNCGPHSIAALLTYKLSRGQLGVSIKNKLTAWDIPKLTAVCETGDRARRLHYDCVRKDKKSNPVRISIVEKLLRIEGVTSELSWFQNFADYFRVRVRFVRRVKGLAEIFLETQDREGLPVDITNGDNVFYVEDNNRHFNAIYIMETLYIRRDFCHVCAGVCSRKCAISLKCPSCNMLQVNHCNENFAFSPDGESPWRKCDRCNRKFNGEECYLYHKTNEMCSKVMRCGECETLLTGEKQIKEHTENPCGYSKCSNCKEMVNPDEHKCFVQLKERDSELIDKVLYFDFESRIDVIDGVNLHVVNYAYFETSDGQSGEFFSLDDFCNCVFSPRFEGYTILAHYMSGYDGIFIRNWLTSNQLHYDVILEAGKINRLAVKKSEKARIPTLVMIDSCKFIPSSLSSMTDIFGLTSVKGYFPHRFNTAENWNYVGPIPPEEMFEPGRMMPAQPHERAVPAKHGKPARSAKHGTRDHFLEWYPQQTGIYNFQEELIKYCKADVTLLREAFTLFRQMIFDRFHVDCLTVCTIAGLSMKTFRVNHLAADTMGIISNQEFVKYKFSKLSINYFEFLKYMEGEKNRIAVEMMNRGYTSLPMDTDEVKQEKKAKKEDDLNLLLEVHKLFKVLPKSRNPEGMSEGQHITMQCFYICGVIESGDEPGELQLTNYFQNPAHAQSSGELQLGKYKVDCAFGELLIDFQGCYWHGCDTCYSSWKPLAGGVKNSDLIRKSAARCEWLKMASVRKYTYCTVKECDVDYITKTRTYTRFLESREKVLGYPGRMNVRDAFYGGRVEVTKLYHKAKKCTAHEFCETCEFGKRCEECAGGEQCEQCEKDKNCQTCYNCGECEKIYSLDFTSLYPSIQKYGMFPIGHPVKITDCSLERLGEYKGVIYCDILPPRKLHLPLLCAKINGKLLFPLCRTCAETSSLTCTHTVEERKLRLQITHLDAAKAISLGYKMLAIHEVHHFDEWAQYDRATKTGGMFTEYVNTMTTLKQEASGWPHHCDTEEKKRAYIAEEFEREGIVIEYDKVEKNPGLRNITKLLNNSLWGKTGQKDNLPQTEIVYERKRLNALMDDKSYILDQPPLIGKSKNKRNINDPNYPDEVKLYEDFVEVTYKMREGHVKQSKTGNIYIAVFTTSQARLKLYDTLEVLGENVLYMDTDSVYFVGTEINPGGVLDIGNGLGQLKDENEGGWITEFVTTGPKSYAYTNNKKETSVKMKGIRQDYDNTQVINIKSMLGLVRQAAEDGKKVVKAKKSKKPKRGEVRVTDKRTIVLQNQLVIHQNRHQQLVSSYRSKGYSFIFDKRIIDWESMKTYPYGYSE